MADLNITLKRSLIGYDKKQALTARALGLGKVGSSITQPDNQSVRGMIQKLQHVLASFLGFSKGLEGRTAHLDRGSVQIDRTPRGNKAGLSVKARAAPKGM